MIKKVIHNLTRKHHTWRDLKFDELAEMYTSISMRSFGFSLIGIFVPIYLYTNGVSLSDIFLFFTVFFAARIPLSVPIARLIGRVGPKHTIALSTVLLIVFLSLLLTFETQRWNIYFLSCLYTFANGLFFISYHTDFSKIQHNTHGGKELGWLYIFERVGSAAGPLVGGLVATLISPEATILLALCMLLGSLIPLFLTAEPVKVHQQVQFKGLGLRRLKRDIISTGAFNVLNFSNGVVWPLFIAVFIFVDDVYAKLGALVALSMVISIVAARLTGKFIDNKKGFYFLRYGSFMNFIANSARAIITAPGGAVAVTSLTEPVAVSYKMSIMKGVFDRADTIEGYRIAYMAMIEMTTAVFKGLVSFGLYLGVTYFDGEQAFRRGFIVFGFIGFLMLVQNFPALKRV